MSVKFAILAAGEGSRLAQEGVKLPKPLVEINGEKMIDRLIRIFLANGANEIDIITNDLTPLTQKHIMELQDKGIPIRLVVKSTPSSMHSFYELEHILSDGKFCLTTVDTIFDEQEFSEYISEFQKFDGYGVMAVTDYIDDESPLYISVDEDGIITDFKDVDDNPKYISGGIYCLDERAFSVLNQCVSEGQSHMRNFQRALVKNGARLKAYRFSKILDVDHKADIQKAEEFLNSRL